MSQQTFNSPNVNDKIEKDYINDLKNAIATYAAAYNDLPLVSPKLDPWSDVTPPALSANDSVLATDINKIVDGINHIRSRVVGSWVSADPVSMGEIISALKLIKIEDSITTAQNSYCYQCDVAAAGYNYSDCVTCDMECNGYSAGSTCPTNGGCPACYRSGCHQYCCGCNMRPGGSGVAICSTCDELTNECGCRGCYDCNEDNWRCWGCYDTLDGGSGCTTCDNQCYLYSCEQCYSTAYRYNWNMSSLFNLTYNGGSHGKIKDSTGEYSSKEYSGIDGSLGPSITAIPDDHYRFLQWNDGVETTTRRDVLSSSNTFTAIQTLMDYTVTVLCRTELGQLISDSPTVTSDVIDINGVLYNRIRDIVLYNNELSTVSAIPNTGMIFLSTWSGDWGDHTPITGIYVDPISGIYSTTKFEHVSSDIEIIPNIVRTMVVNNYYSDSTGQLYMYEETDIPVVDITGGIISPTSIISGAGDHIALDIPYGSSGYNISACPIDPTQYQFDSWSDGATGITITDPICGICNIRLDTNVTTMIEATAIFTPI